MAWKAGCRRSRRTASIMLALPYFKVPDFILYKLPGANIAEPIKLAFEFLILTAARTNEVIYANPDEIADDTWTIPGKRMKAGRPHKVPLPARSVEIVKRAKEIGRGDYIFPGRIKGKPLSNMAFLMALRRMGVDTTAHGFRSSFRDWAAEETNFPREVCEMALAHLLTTKQLVKEIASWLPRKHSSTPKRKPASRDNKAEREQLDRIRPRAARLHRRNHRPGRCAWRPSDRRRNHARRDDDTGGGRAVTRSSAETEGQVLAFSRAEEGRRQGRLLWKSEFHKPSPAQLCAPQITHYPGCYSSSLRSDWLESQ